MMNNCVRIHLFTRTALASAITCISCRSIAYVSCAEKPQRYDFLYQLIRLFVPVNVTTFYTSWYDFLYQLMRLFIPVDTTFHTSWYDFLYQLTLRFVALPQMKLNVYWWGVYPLIYVKCILMTGLPSHIRKIVRVISTYRQYTKWYLY